VVWTISNSEDLKLFPKECIPDIPYHEKDRLPAAGNGNNSSLNNAGSNGNYWSSSFNNDNNAWNLNFNSDNVNTNNNNRNNGRSVRPVTVSIRQFSSHGYFCGVLYGQSQQTQYGFSGSF